MTYPDQLRDAVESGLFSATVSEQLEHLLDQYRAGSLNEANLRAHADAALQAELQHLEPSAAALQRLVAAVLNSTETRVRYTRPDGTAGERARWWANMPFPHLQQGIQALGMNLRHTRADLEAAEREAHRLRAAAIAPLFPAEAPAAPAPVSTRHQNPWEATTNCVLRSAKSGRFLGLRPGRRKVHFKNFVSVPELHQAVMLTRGQATLQCAILRANPRVAQYVRGRRNFQVCVLGLQSVD